MVADGRFRQDLYYRISAFPIHLPPLRERVEDIPLLAASFLARSPTSRGKRLTIDPPALARLQAHAWPGNIRELRNVLDRASLFADDQVLRAEHLPPGLGETGQVLPLPVSSPAGHQAAAGRPAPLDDAALRTLAAEFGGSRRALAARLGLSERTLYRRLQQLGRDEITPG